MLEESQIRPGSRQGEGGIEATPGHGFVSLQQDQAGSDPRQSLPRASR